MDLATLGIKVENGQIVATAGALDRLTGAGQKAEGQFGRLKGAAAALGVTLGAGAVFGKFVRETIDSQNAMAQLEARVKSTGMAAGFSATQLAAMAGEMQRLTTFSDDAVMGAQSLLLTFTKIQGDTLPAATQAVADLAVAMGGDLKGAALQLGKALQDPEQGLLALRRSGVSFTEVQQEVIKGLFATGREAEAQAMILAELRKEFGGAATAARDTFGGALSGLSNAFGDLFGVSRAGTSGIVGFINATTKAVENLNAMRGAIVTMATALAGAALAPVIARWAGALAAFNTQLVATNGARRAAAVEALASAQSESFAARTFQSGAASRLRALTALGAPTATLEAAELRLSMANRAVTSTAASTVTAQNALAAATTRTGAAMATAATMARGLWAAIGGPVGAAVVAATGAYALLTRAIDKKNDAIDEEDRKQQEATNKVIAGIRARREAAEQKRLEAEAARLAAERQARADAAELTGLERKIRRQRELDQYRQAVVDRIEKEIRLQERLNALLSGNGPSPKVQGGLAMPTLTTRIGTGSAPVGSGLGANDPTPTPEQRARYQAWLDETVRMEQKVAQERAAVYENFLRGMQEGFARAFENIFTKGISSFRDLFRTFGDLVKQAASQLAASGLMNFLTGTYARGAAAGGGVSGGVGALVSAIPGWGAVVAGVAFVGSQMLGIAKDNEEAQARFEQAAKKWRTGFDTFLRSFTETDFDRQRRALADQFKALADAAIAGARERIPGLKTLGNMGDLGSYASAYLPSTVARNSDVVQALAQQLDALNAAYQRQVDALKAVTKELEAQATADLRVRQLRAAGMNDEAAALELWNRQVKEFADAVKAGFSMDFLKELSRTQELERNQLAAAQSAERAAAAQRQLAEMQERAAASAAAAAERLAATQERAAQFSVTLADATESLAVRLLRAQGNISEADKKAFALQQAQEVRAAEREIFALQREKQQIAPMWFGNSWNYKDYWGGPMGPEANAANAQVTLINQMIADQMKYIAELKTVQAAEAAAFTAAQGLPAVSASTQGGSFNTVVSRTTAEQGDRMVDNLVTMRTLAQEFWPYLKTIADRLSGGVNTMLGTSYQQSAALAGSSLVT